MNPLADIPRISLGQQLHSRTEARTPREFLQWIVARIMMLSSEAFPLIKLFIFLLFYKWDRIDEQIFELHLFKWKRTYLDKNESTGLSKYFILDETFSKRKELVLTNASQLLHKVRY